MSSRPISPAASSTSCMSRRHLGPNTAYVDSTCSLAQKETWAESLVPLTPHIQATDTFWWALPPPRSRIHLLLLATTSTFDPIVTITPPLAGLLLCPCLLQSVLNTAAKRVLLSLHHILYLLFSTLQGFPFSESKPKQTHVLPGLCPCSLPPFDLCSLLLPPPCSSNRPCLELWS